MSALSTMGRLAEMDRDEIRFRLTCEARKIAGRLRCAVSPPQWDRAAILRVLNPDSGTLVARACQAAGRNDYLGAHRALSEHIRTRASSWPVRATDRAQLTSLIRDAMPSAAGGAGVQADRIVDGRFDVLGHRDLALGNPPDWHADAVHGRQAPLVHWAVVPFLDPRFGDHKIIWETNRHQHFLVLGSAYWLTDDPRYRAVFTAQLEDWLRANPPLRGTNWSSMLELAFRTISWTWAVEFFAAGAEEDATPWLVDLLVSLDRQLTHVAHNLSSYFSPNTHLSGEALALYAVSTAFPELRPSGDRAAAGREILLREASNQVRGDGGHVELSAHYHRYSTDFYLLALMVARRSGDAAAEVFEQAARKQAEYLRTIADDRGRLPLIGDDDGGRLFKFGDSAPADASATLAAAASLLSDPLLAVGSPAVETWWMLGHAPAPGGAAAPRWPSQVLSDSGYLVSRSPGGGQLVFDAGPHGFLNGGHAHSDALAVVLSVEGEPLLVDPGTGTYTMDAELRDRFRSSRMHNTVVLDGRDHAIPNGPFSWSTRADARFLVARIEREFDFAVGIHDGYRQPRHLRAVLAVHGTGWLVVDRIVTNQATSAQAWWHLHPNWHARVRPGTVELSHRSGGRLALATTAEAVSLVQDPALSVWAPEYGRLEPAATIVATHSGTTSFVIGTFIPAAAAGDDPITIVETPGATPSSGAWTEAAFAVRSGGQHLHLSVAFPRDGEAQPSRDWPQPCITRHEQ